jgi:hypothetical protein
MLDDIGRPSAKEIARAFKVSEATVKKWMRADAAPHAVMLAVFWITRWGISAIDCEAHNAAIMSAGLARSRLEAIESLEKKIQRLAQIANFGSANDPAPGVVPSASRPVLSLIVEKLAVETALEPGSSDHLKTKLNPISMRVVPGFSQKL